MLLTTSVIKKLSKIHNSLYDEIKVNFLYHSNKLEGSTFDKQNLIDLLQKRQVSGEHFLDDVIETRNSLDLFDEVINTLGEPLDKFLLLNWHRILKRGSVDDEINNIGMWKKYFNKLLGTDLKLSKPEEVENHIFNLLADWNESDKNISDIADFHQRFEQIHPFQDGNGRIGRFLILKQCIENSVDLISIDNEYNKQYRDALYKAQTTSDIGDLINVFIKCQRRFDEKLKPYEEMINQVSNEI